MGDASYDMEVHFKKDAVELTRDWMEGATANDYRITVHRANAPDLHGSMTKAQFNYLEGRPSQLAFNAAAPSRISMWWSMTPAERADAWGAFDAPGLIFLRVHKGAISYLSPADIVDSTISPSELADFGSEADVSEQAFLAEVDGSTIDTWFTGLTSGQRSDFASNFANR